MKRKNVIIFLLTLSLMAQSLIGNTVVAHAEESMVTHSQLSDFGTAEPDAWGATPSANQYKYQKDELAGFCHFGMNTFTGVEWGSGTESPSQFQLTEEFDAESLVKGLYDAGFKKLIVTAKHHDGFCIWRSAYTEHDLESTNYSGDVLAEISAACTKYDMDMGLYLSPWDANNESYGYRDADGNACDVSEDVLDYNDYYNNQLIEILGNDQYGNNGHFVEVWMDGAKGSGAMAQEYDFTRWFTTIQSYEGKAAGYEDDCLLFGAEAYTTVHWIGNELGFANEETWAKVNCDKETNTFDANRPGSYAIGYPDANTWSVPEADARITSGWFWGSYKNTPKSVEELGEMYFRSVGHNATLLLNVPPNSDGTVDQAILNRLQEFGDAIEETFSNNLAESAAASSVRGNDVQFSPDNVLDGADDTYWAPDGDVTTGTLEIDLGGQRSFDVVSIEEAIELGQRISGFSVEYQLNGGEWKTFEEGTTIGAKRLCRQEAVKADKIRINITSSYALPLINEVGVYRAAEEFAVGNGIPEGLEIIDNTDTDTADGAGFTYTGWNQETGEQYLNGTNMWANAGSEATVTFSGTKAWILGTVDPAHGTADIYIDGQKQDVGMSTNATVRKVGQRIYETPDLEDTTHTLRIVNTDQAIGIEGVLVLNNGGKGMLELEFDSYTVPEDNENSFRVKRVGGSNGEISVTFEDNPGSAVQSEFLPTNGIQLTFADGETEKIAKVTTKRQTLETGDLSFYIGLVNPTDDAIIGFNSTAKVTIMDTETPRERTSYTENDRFYFPTTVGKETLLEAEYFVLQNTGENESWPLQIGEADWASNGKFVNCLNTDDTISLYYTAEVAGEYTAVVTYRSGDTRNALAWAEDSGKITAGSKTVGASDSAGATHTETIDFVVETAGEGVLVFTGPQYNSPQLDKFEITLVNPVNTEPEAPESGYAVSLSEDAAVSVGEDANVTVNVYSQEATYNTYYFVFNYNPEVLTYKSVSGDAAVSDANGRLTVMGYGEDQSITDAVTLTFTGKAPNGGNVTLIQANIDKAENANAQDAPAAIIEDAETYIRVNGYQVTLSDDFVGSGAVNAGEDYTFRAKNPYYTYEFTATMGGVPVEVIVNNDGTYTIENVTGDLQVTAEKTPMSFDVETEGNGAADVILSGDTAVYMTDYTFELDEKSGYHYQVSVAIDGDTYRPTIDADGKTYRISGEDIKGNIVITAAKTEASAETTQITFVGNGSADVVGDNPAIAENDQDFTFTINKDENYDYIVQLTNPSQELTADRNGIYTITSDKLEGTELTVRVTKTPNVERVVAVSEYVKLQNGRSMFLVTAAGILDEGHVFAYDDNTMSYSEEYGAYAYLVISDQSLEDVREEAESRISEIAAARVSIVYDGDVNATGITDINDAQVTYNMYNTYYNDFTTVSMDKFLRADMNHDKMLTVLDSAAIVEILKH